MTPITMVEDDLILADMYVARFELEGLAVSKVTRGDQAAARIKQDHPRLVILDIRLPGKDGLEVLAELKKSPATAKIPVIVFTAAQDKTKETRAKELGASRFFNKAQTEPRDLVKAVKALLN